MKGDIMTINERMFEIMAQKNIKDIELARCIDKSKSVISSWRIRGANPPADCIVQICELLKISPYYLLTGEEAPDLPEEEQELLKAFRSANETTQDNIRMILRLPEKERSSNLEQEVKIS